MFKQKKIKSKARMRKTLVDSDDDSAASTTNRGDDESSAMDAILQAKKKRKLLNAMQYKRGLDAAATMQARSSIVGSSTRMEETTAVDTVKNKDLEERLKGTFSGGTGGDFSSGDRVIDQKHKSAMEEFIRQNLVSNEEATRENAQTTALSTADPSTVKELERKLYAELASSSQSLTGKTEKEQVSGAEGDIGSGGAMLGGTGIAEVTLPVDERLKTASETATAVLQRQHRLPAEPKRVSVNPTVVTELPMNFAVGRGKRRGKDAVPMMSVVAPAATVESEPSKTVTLKEGGHMGTASSAGYGILGSDVSNVASSYSHNFRLHAQEWLQDKKESERATDESTRDSATDETTVVDPGRIGFDAARRAARGEVVSDRMTGSDKSQAEEVERRKRSSDGRVYKQFMSRQNAQRGRR